MSETVNQVTNGNEQTEAKTFTQDELNQVVNDRLKRERAKYEDYESLKEKAARLDQIEADSKSELQKATEKAGKLEAELNALKNAEKIRGIREAVAKETGVPSNLLTGDTEESCKEQAEAIKAFAKPTYPNIRDSGEVMNTGGSSTREQFAEWMGSQM